MLNNFGTIYRVENYNNGAYRIIKSYRTSKNIHNFITDTFSNSAETSLSRTKRNIRRICLSNDFEYFATWTINSAHCDRFFLTDCVEKMKILLKSFKRLHKDFKYIYIIEKHKNGAFHFHGLIKGVPISEFIQFKIGDKMSWQLARKVEKGFKCYHLSFFDNKLGFNTFTKIEHYNKCCNYILKYISKDTVRTNENQIYFCSRGLSKGESYEVKYIPYELFNNSYVYQDLCEVKDIYIENLTREELILFGNIVD